ncbi:MAG: GHKL domain-containing protein [Aliifodinibius sp.]|nr:GHKL domain-containing protein [Fodinibius sp.]NIV09734.1 GHKL domain-containing protein [Fodinibius sp.]NIY23260.1 GHKL domain-containing protein [Fodinibius sp.]
MALEIDMRHQKLLEARILQNERLAAIGQMAARIAHEIRNPISSIGLNAELLEDEITGPERNTSNEAKVLLKSIMNEVDRVANLLDEYLQFSRFPSTQLKPGNITVLIREVLGDFEMAAKADAINIFSQFEPDLPDINFDALQMRRVIMNLCRNSIEAMPMGGTLEVHVQRKDDHLLEIRVSDTGLGISKEDKDRIFKPFYTTKESGTGLGLSIIQQIILEHNGNIYCESENGRGTIFYITLPLKNV